MKILVTGAGGFIGKNLVSRLTGEHNVKSFLYYKQKEERKFLENIGSEVVLGDIADPKTLKGITDNVDVVINLSAQRRGWDTSKDISYRVNVLGTKNLIEESIGSDVDHFIHCSTSSIIGPVEDKPLNENSQKRDESKIYYRTKMMGDRVVSSHSNDINTTIIMPPLVYGPHDDHHLPIFKAVRDGRMHIIGDGDNIFQPTYIDDCIEGFILTMNNKDAYGETFIIGSDEYRTSREIIYTISITMNRDTLPSNIPYLPAKTGSIIAEFFGKLIGYEPPLNQRVLDWFTENHFYDISKAKSILNYEPKVSLEEGIEKTVDWYRNEGWL